MTIHIPEPNYFGIEEYNNSFFGKNNCYCYTSILVTVEVVVSKAKILITMAVEVLKH